MKRIIKLAILAVISVCVCGAAILIFIPQNPGSPDLQVSDVKGKLQGQGSFRNFLLYFAIKNNGTSKATNVGGIAAFERSGGWTTVNWGLSKVENVIEAGEKVSGCYAFFWGYSTVPSENFIITVLCDEGVSREFNVTIS